MKSDKQRRLAPSAAPDPRDVEAPVTAPCNPDALAPYNSYGQPPFVERGHYVDTPFRCAGCGKEEVWRATQQKWWYEVAKGHVETRAKWCHACRRVERERRDEARRVHMEGLARKGKA